MAQLSIGQAHHRAAVATGGQWKRYTGWAHTSAIVTDTGQRRRILSYAVHAHFVCCLQLFISNDRLLVLCSAAVAAGASRSHGRQPSNISSWPHADYISDLSYITHRTRNQSSSVSDEKVAFRSRRERDFSIHRRHALRHKQQPPALPTVGRGRVDPLG